MYDGFIEVMVNEFKVMGYIIDNCCFGDVYLIKCIKEGVEVVFEKSGWGKSLV